VPHVVDSDSIRESVFLIQNLVFASRPLCERIVQGAVPTRRVEITNENYFPWLHSTLSRLLLGVAIKTRVTMDILDAERRWLKKEDEADIEDVLELSKGVSRSYAIGRSTPDSGTINIREACNKLIHANRVLLVNEPLIERDPDLDQRSDPHHECVPVFWGGVLRLEGEKASSEWIVDLNVSEFCFALVDLVDRIDDLYDWPRVYKALGY
jgi:hypothetical protein